MRDAGIPCSELFELAQAGSDWIWETDAELRFSWLSENYEEATGVAAEKVLGRFRFDFLKQGPIGSKDAEAHLDDLQSRRPFRDFVYEFSAGRPDCRWVSITGFPRFSAEGVFLGYRGVGPQRHRPDRAFRGGAGAVAACGSR